MPLPTCEGDDIGLQAFLVFLHQFLSFSRLSRSVHRLSLSSLTSLAPQHSQSIHATYKMLNNLSIIFHCSHSPYMRHTKPWQTWMASKLYFIVLAVHTCDVQNHDRLWMASRSYFIILTVRTRNVRNHDRLPPVWGSHRLAPISMLYMKWKFIK